MFYFNNEIEKDMIQMFKKLCKYPQYYNYHIWKSEKDFYIKVYIPVERQFLYYMKSERYEVYGGYAFRNVLTKNTRDLNHFDVCTIKVNYNKEKKLFKILKSHFHVYTEHYDSLERTIKYKKTLFGNSLYLEWYNMYSVYPDFHKEKNVHEAYIESMFKIINFLYLQNPPKHNIRLVISDFTVYELRLYCMVQLYRLISVDTNKQNYKNIPVFKSWNKSKILEPKLIGIIGRYLY